MLEPDSSDYEGSAPSTISEVSRHVHSLQLQVNTLEARIAACQRRILQLEAEVAVLRAPRPQASWGAVLLHPFTVCFQR